MIHQRHRLPVQALARQPVGSPDALAVPRQGPRLAPAARLRPALNDVLQGARLHLRQHLLEGRVRRGLVATPARVEAAAQYCAGRPQAQGWAEPSRSARLALIRFSTTPAISRRAALRAAVSSASKSISPSRPEPSKRSSSCEATAANSASQALSCRRRSGPRRAAWTRASQTPLADVDQFGHQGAQALALGDLRAGLGQQGRGMARVRVLPLTLAVRIHCGPWPRVWGCAHQQAGQPQRLKRRTSEPGRKSPSCAICASSC